MAPGVIACPRCGARLQVVPQQPAVTCTYCGTTTPLGGFAAGGAYAPAPPPPNKPAFPLGAALAGAGVLLFLVVGAGALLFVLPARSLVNSTSSTSTAARGSEAPTPEAAHAAAAPAEKAAEPPRLERGKLLIADVNGDGASDFMSLGSQHEKKGMSRRFFAFDGKTGKELWRTVDLGNDALSLHATVEQAVLVFANRQGAVTGYDTTTGKQLWVTSADERVRSFCRAAPGSIRVLTADERTKEINLKTSGIADVAGKPKCDRLPSTEEDRFSRDIRDRSDPSAPPGVKSVVCGGVRVMGDQNFTLPEQCKAQLRIDPDALDGIDARAMWQHAGGLIVLGTRKPGTRVPRVGFVKGGKVVWSSDVPASDPLTMREGSPNQVALAGETLVVAYEPQSGDASAGITAFDVTSGRRLWDTRLSGKLRSVSDVQATAANVFVTAGDNVVGIATADGKQLFVVGDGD